MAAILVAALVLLASPGWAAEPEHILSAKVASMAMDSDGKLVRTSQGLGWAGPWGLQALQGGEDLDLQKESLSGVLVSAPQTLWMLSAEDPRYGGYFDPQLRGRITVHALDPAHPLTPRGARTVQPLGWPLAASERADGRLGVVLWTKGLPLLQGRGHRMVLWSPSEGVISSRDWSIHSIQEASLTARPDGSWRLLSMLSGGGDSPCGKAEGVVLTTIAADLRIAARQRLCLPPAIGKITIEAGDRGDWFVIANDYLAIRLFRVSETPEGPFLRPLFQASAAKGGFRRPQFALAADGTVFLGRDRRDGWNLYRIAADGSAIDYALTHVGCEGAPGKNAILHLDSIDGVAHATLSAREGSKTCLNIWRL